jgi:HSP20 family protein
MQDCHENQGKHRSFFDVLNDFIQKDVKEFSEEMRDWGKKFRQEFHYKWGNDFFKSMPLMNVIETESDFSVRIAVPGLQKDDIKISLKDNHLTISADVEYTLNEGEKYHKHEYDYGKFRRSFHLPEDVQDDAIEAKYDNGILIIRIPKRVKENQSSEREINID